MDTVVWGKDLGYSRSETFIFANIISNRTTLLTDLAVTST